MSNRPRVFRDPVHTNIEFSRIDSWDVLAGKLIQTREVQRLRRVRQLGLASLVYHGAEHSRFVHTLGVTHVAKRLYLAAANHSGVAIDEKEFATVVASALLHDTGHPPFSHAVEKELGVRHERVTVHILRDHTEVNRVLREFGGDEFVEAVAAHIEGSTDTPTVDLISSQLDADRLDYVLRDGYYAGVPNAQYDLDRIIQMVLRDAEGICFDYRAQIAIEGYFTARYHLYLQLYYHKTVRAAEVMLRSVIRRARLIAQDDPSRLDPINPALRELFTTGDAAQAVAVSDVDLWSAFGIWATGNSDPILKDLSRRLLNRDLFRAIEIPVDAMPKFYEEWLPRAQEIAKTNGFDPEYYVRPDTARDTPYKIADLDTSTSVRITDADGVSHQLEALSGLIGALQGEAYQKLRCCIPAQIRAETRAAFT
jgi:HD superfamily phosphohydrolase